MSTTMSTILFESARTFRLWEYRVSHDLLLLRSPKNDQYRTNADVIFRGVEYVELPSLLKGLAIRRGDTTNDATNEQPPAEQRVVVSVVSGGRRYSIVATALLTRESAGDIFDTKLEL